MNDPNERRLTGTLDVLDALDDEAADWPMRKPNRDRRFGQRTHRKQRTTRSGISRKRGRVESSDGVFRCRRCKTIVGPPLSGGRHRNHCPLCLYSRHVDQSPPGDRLSDCRSMMRPVGLFARRDGEQVLVHDCLGCGVVRHNRVAADDKGVVTMRLPILAERGSTKLESLADESA